MSSSTYAARRQRFYRWMESEGISAVVFEDREGQRSTAVRYLSGQPGDSLLFLVNVKGEAKSTLVSWDVNMARRLADADEILAYTDFGRDAATAAGSVFKNTLPAGARIEVSSATPYPRFVDLVEALGDWDLTCRDDGSEEAVAAMRAVKDEAELEAIRKAAGITDEISAILEAGIRDGSLKTELDVAMAIERESRARGAEGTSFETLAAGPNRSFGIHAFPPFGPGPVGGQGLTIIDFGVKYAGYGSDVTLTFARGPLSPVQEEMIALVEKAYGVALEAIRPGVEAKAVSKAVDAVFAEKGRAMPHALGHGIGLEDHEAPFLRAREDNEWKLTQGMVLAIEPGLYEDEAGGVRLENDVIVTESGPVLLTKARIVWL